MTILGLTPILDRPTDDVTISVVGGGGWTTAGSSANPTYSAVAIGAAAYDRWVVAFVSFDSGGPTLSSATIGGIAATIIGQDVFDVGTRSGAWIAAAVPTGTTADIVLVFVGACASGIAVYRVLGGTNTFVFQSALLIASIAVTVPAHGTVLVAARNGTSASGVSWTNATEDIDTALGGDRGSTAHRSTAGASTISVSNSLAMMAAIIS